MSPRCAEGGGMVRGCIIESKNGIAKDRYVRTA